MRSRMMIVKIAMLLTLSLSIAAEAELQSVEVGGALKIRGNYYTDGYGVGQGSSYVRWRPFSLLGRPTGATFASGEFPGGPRLGSITSSFAWDNEADGQAFVLQRSTLNVRANFSEGISTFVELENYGAWGKGNERSNYVTGLDRYSDAEGIYEGDVHLYQAYIGVEELFGAPVQMKLGRQEILLFNEWLVGNNSEGQKFSGLSFDALRLTYQEESSNFSVDFFASILAESTLSDDLDDDTVFAGLSAKVEEEDDYLIGGYWLFLRENVDTDDTTGLASNWIEGMAGVDDYGAVKLHTIGLTASKTFPAVPGGALEIAGDLAYQFGDAGYLGSYFRPYNFLDQFFTNSLLFGRSRYGDDDGEFSNWAAQINLTYEADLKFAPLFTLDLAYYGGEDNRELSFGDRFRTAINPFYEPTGSYSFNTLFSDTEYSRFLALDSSLSNVWLVKVANALTLTDKITMQSSIAYFETLEAFDSPLFAGFGGARFFIPGVDRKNETDLGWETELLFIYEYSENLVFSMGWAHLFVGDGLSQGSFSDGNGLLFNGGSSSDDTDYIYAESNIEF